MTALDGNMDITRALEDCRRRVQGGEALESCLADYPAECREEIGRLMPLAGRLSQLGREPSPEFRARLERRLLAAVDEARRSQGSGLPGRFRRLFDSGPLLRVATLAAVVLVILAGSGIGMAQAADSSLPDSPLYQVKQAREWVEIALARDEEARAAAHDRQIAQRSDELSGAVQARKPGRVIDLVAARAAISAEQMVDRALASQARGNPRPSIRTLITIRTMQRRLDRLEAQAPPEVRPSLQRLRSSLDEQSQRLIERAAPRRAGRQLKSIP